MNKYNLLDCTLRDGGYITNWSFDDAVIKDLILSLTNSALDFVEVGYLNNKPYTPHTVQFNNIEQIADFLPLNRQKTSFLAMADVEQFSSKQITQFTGKSIDGIRVVFYKHQIEKAITLAKSIKECGYQLFIQPMVTIDYSIEEYSALSETIAQLNPTAVSIVDSFGYMLKSDFRKYYKILDNILSDDTIIGFHSHNNMNLAFLTGQDILEYQTSKKLVIDSSLFGMGRGAGNLQTELIANYYNMTFGNKYDVIKILDLIGKYIMPIKAKKNWGYSPYFFLTGLYKCHPNYVTYLLEEHDISVSMFKEYLDQIPIEMYTKCRKPYVLDKYNEFLASLK
ncbi:aldolase catalytic domain-containing protein [Lachnospiraceae bacterium OttesenSCG-928-D06]|nr:aldolase catalytic domain-containing protein [Lachnospiraceae bacterium OttesenSCG-928-D06]